MSDETLSPGGRSLLIAAALAGVAIAPSAHAGTAGAAFAAASISQVSYASNCRRASSAAFATAQTAGDAALVTRPREKKMSALERMRMQQAGAASATVSFAQEQAIATRPSYMPAIAAMAEASALKNEQAEQAVTPAIVPAAVFGATCASLFDASRPGVKRKQQDFLESRILPISSTAFDAAWTRVASAPAGKGVAQAALLAGAGNEQMADRIAEVNRWVNRKVAYKSDAALYGQADYWASADETLRRGEGDCEDYAIAKMEILAAMGIAREDMYLTLARDLIRRADHAVLIVKLDGRSIMLDNASDSLLDGDTANDYRPVLSFSAGKRFLHGY